MPKYSAKCKVQSAKSKNSTNHYALITNHFKLKQGFTLIELLIVITILGILATLTLASYSGTQEKARDGVRKSDLAQIKRAMELAKSDCQGNAYYPSDGTPANSVSSAVDDYNSFLRGYLTATALKYISNAPVDPRNSDPQQYGFSVGGSTLATACPDSAGTPNAQPGYGDFLFAVKLERTSDADAAKSATTCTGTPNIASYSGIGWYFVCNK